MRLGEIQHTPTERPQADQEPNVEKGIQNDC